MLLLDTASIVTIFTVRRKYTAIIFMRSLKLNETANVDLQGSLFDCSAAQNTQRNVCAKITKTGINCPCFDSSLNNKANKELH